MGAHMTYAHPPQTQTGAYLLGVAHTLRIARRLQRLGRYQEAQAHVCTAEHRIRKASTHAYRDHRMNSLVRYLRMFEIVRREVEGS